MNLSLQSNRDGTYSVLVRFDRDDAEFGLDILSRKNTKKVADSVAAFVKKQGKNITVSTVKFLMAGIIVASIPLAAYLPAEAAAAGKYSQAYMYLGTATDQINYVKNTSNSLNAVSPSWFDINPDGSIKVNTISKALVDAMHAQNIKVVPFLSNHWDQKAGINFLKNIDAYSTQLAGYVQTYNLDGLNVDIENVTPAERAQYVELMRQLRQKIPAGKELSVAVAANPNGWTTGWHGSYDYAGLGQYSDHLFIMAYDESWQGGPAGPVASIGFVENSVKYALKYVPASKVVLGLPLYGRLWSSTGFNGQGVYLNLADKLTATYNATVTFDAASATPKATFTVKAGDPSMTVLGKALTPGTYTLWYENQQSLYQKLQLVTKYNLKGAGSWALGQESLDIWKDYTAVLNNKQVTPPTTTVPKPTTTAPKTTAPTSPTQPAGGGTPGGTTATRPAPSGAPTAPAPPAGGNAQTASTEEQGDTSNDAAPSDGLQEGDIFAVPDSPIEVVDLPLNLIAPAEIGDAWAEIYVQPQPHAHVLARIAAGTFVVILSVTAVGYYKIKWGRLTGFIQKSALKDPPENV